MMEHESASRDTSVIESSYGESDSLVSVSVYHGAALKPRISNFFSVFHRNIIHDRFHVTSNEIGIFKSGKFVSRSDFSIKLKYFVVAGVETGYVAEITSTHLSEKTK